MRFAKGAESERVEICCVFFQVVRYMCTAAAAATVVIVVLAVVIQDWKMDVGNGNEYT